MKRVFIGGMGRSGTTISLNAMYRHGELMAIPIETKFFVELDGFSELADALTRDYSTACVASTVERFTDLMRNQVTGLVPASYSEQHDLSSNIFRHYHTALDEFLAVLERRRYFHDRDELLQLIRNFADKTFDDLARISDKAGWVEKTPANFWRMSFLRELWPDSYFVHLIRDPREIFRSLIEKTWLPADLRVAIAHFNGSMQALVHTRRTMLVAPRFVEVRLEDLESDPVSTLDSLAEALGLRPFGEDAVAGVAASMSRYAEQKQSAPGLRFSNEDATMINQALLPWIEELGYSLDFPQQLLAE